MMTWTRGRHLVKFGVGIPHINRRAFDDNTNALGTYTFGPTLAADGVTVLQSALEQLRANHPSGFSQNSGEVHFIYHQQEMGAFVQDQFKVNSRFSITPGIRYDWQNFLATKRLGFSPRVSFAWVLDEASKTVVRGGGGIYYDRFGSGSLLDLARYEGVEPRRRAVTLSLDPAAQPATGCVPIRHASTSAAAPVARVELDPRRTDALPDAVRPLHRAPAWREGDRRRQRLLRARHRSFRSVDINAPTPQSGYTERPDPAYGRIRQMQPAGFFEGSGLDVSYRGRFNKYFTGFGRYTWSHYESNTDGIGWFPAEPVRPRRRVVQRQLRPPPAARACTP